MTVKLRIVKWRAIRRFFNLTLGGLAMITVAMVSAFIAMRLAIHGREVKVPDLTHMTISEASRKASSMGLRLQLENKYYSPETPPGEVLAQFPAPGMVVRRQWPVRVTESLGAQQVAIPNLIGEGERAASINLRRLGLELGTVGHIAVPGTAGVVVAQTPPPNAQGVERPRVSVLLSEPVSEAGSDEAFVMPALVGLSLSGAYARAGAAGLRIVSAEDMTPNAPAAATSGAIAAGATASAASSPVASSAPGPGVVAAQSPPAGYRVAQGQQVRLSLVH